MTTDLAKARERTQRFLDFCSHQDPDAPVTVRVGDMEVLLAATEPVKPGELAEAMEAIEFLLQGEDRDDGVSCMFTVSHRYANAFRTVLRAVRQQGERVVIVGGWPGDEADPELVVGWRNMNTQTLTDELALGEDVLRRKRRPTVAFWERRNAAIRQVLKERETNGA